MSERKFGTFKGVFVPNVTMMFGVILFLRLGLVIGYVGIGKFALILGLSLLVMLITSFSIASIVTNMQVGSGGVYYLISRSLGLEIGGALGFALILSQVISLSLCTIGFAYSLTGLFPDLSLTLVELVTLSILLFITLSGANIAINFQSFILVLLLLAIGSIFLGLKPEQVEPMPHFLLGLKFWEAFALFYPAMTGIEAGMALSGNLKNPSKSLAIGNIFSLLFAALIYFLVGVMLYLHVPLEDLRATPLILLEDTLYPSLIYLGIWCATLSSAVGNLMGSSKMLQMIAEDGILPKFFGKSKNGSGEPRASLFFIFFVALLIVFFTSIDEIIPILTMICLITYGTLNFVASMADLIHAASWRPEIKTPWQVSLIGSFLCLFFMLMIDPTFTFISIFSVIGIYFLIKGRALSGSFIDIRESILFYFSRKALYRLARGEESAKHFTPQILVLSKAPTQVESMIHLSNALTYGNGILTVASIVPPYWETEEKLSKREELIYEWLRDISVECLVKVASADTVGEGMTQLIKSYGIGSYEPNSVMIDLEKHLPNVEMELIEMMETAKVYQKNLLLYHMGPSAKKSFHKFSARKKRIDLFFEPDTRHTFELMLSLLLSLRLNPYFTRSQATLHASVPDETAKKHLSDHFKEQFKKLRIKINPSIHITDDPDLFSMMKHVSKSSDLILCPLKSHSEFEDPYEFSVYLDELRKKLTQNAPTLLITCNDGLDHKEVFSD